MTLRHIVLIQFTGGVDPDFLAAMDEGVVRMAAIPEVLAGSGGRDVSGKPDNFDYAIILDFADHAAYERYRVHPVHQAFIADFMRSHPMEKVRIQLELPSN